jgi:hypothetical protein
MVVLPMMVFGQMESDSYQILFDSVNTGGGLSGSDNYSLEDTTGEIATGRSESDFYRIAAGYQQMDDAYISIVTTGDIALGSLNGVSGGESLGTSTATVLTDSPSGYELYVSASGTPSLVSLTSSFDDYAPVAADPDFSFSYDPSESLFGFTPEGSDIIARFKDNGSVCATGSLDTTSRCWDGFATSTELIAEGDSNHPSGTNTTLKVQAAIGSNRLQAPGNYVAYITLTAISK